MIKNTAKRLTMAVPYSCPPKTQMRPNCGVMGVSLRKVSVFQDKFKGNTLHVVLWGGGGGATNSLFLELTDGPTFCSSAAMQSHISRAAKRGCFKRGGFLIWTCPSFFVPFCPFWDFPDFSGIFPICSGMVRGFSRFVPFLFRGLSRAPTRNSPGRVRDTIWTFPEKSGKHPGLETPRFSFCQIYVLSPAAKVTFAQCKFCETIAASVNRWSKNVAEHA